MKLNNLYQKFGTMLVFDKPKLRLFEKNENNLNLNIKYWIKNKKIISLKKGWYALTEKYSKESDKDFYLEFIANKLIEPSYLSGEYVLNKYGVLTEAVSAITSMTTGLKREIKNQLSVFRYYSISDKLFQGYQVNKKRGNIFILEADLAKALFDFLYLRFFRNLPVNEKAVKNLRINWENISPNNFKKSRSYLKKIRSRKMATLYKIINDTYYAG